MPKFTFFFLVLIIISIIPFTASAKSCSNGNIHFTKTVHSTNHQLLHLNGTGSREKFFFDVYIAALYLPETDTSPEKIFKMPGEKQIQLHFLRGVSAEKLREGWRDGFVLNHTEEELISLQERLNYSYQLFTAMKSGDVIHINLVPGHGTQVVNNGVPGEIIKGDDFAQAVLRVWLGKHPPQELLKQCLLGL